MDFKQERTNDVDTIIKSTHPKKVVVAGPGTGKSYLFEQIIKNKKLKGKKEFLAITFIGKLGDELADDLAGLASTMTLHGFARKFLLDNCPDGWKYYPDITKLIGEDLKIKGITSFKIGDINYEERTKYYKTVGHDDVVYYAIQICKKDNSKIPKYDLILVDEFQDFNEIESEFIDILSTKNEILIVGDDDQALYEFKGSSPKFIRGKYNSTNTDFESHTLRFCSRCTEVIIEAFHDVVKHFKTENKMSDRIDKEYICYSPDKDNDNSLNSNILIAKGVATGQIPLMIKHELNEILKEQKIKSALVIGEARTCKSILRSISRKLRELGFKNVNYSEDYMKTYSFKPNVVEGYKLLSEGKNILLAWRLLLEEIDNTDQRNKIISENYDNPVGLVDALPKNFRDKQEKDAKTLNSILSKPKSGRNQIANSSIEELFSSIVSSEKEKREMFIEQLIDENNIISRPLGNIDINVCSILGSKGLGADVVFLIGFDQGKLPLKDIVQESEIYQLLVALTRAKKRIYFINTLDNEISKFIECIEKDRYKII
jgi:superfamily I DNA/RNA helicase